MAFFGDRLLPGDEPAAGLGVDNLDADSMGAFPPYPGFPMPGDFDPSMFGGMPGGMPMAAQERLAGLTAEPWADTDLWQPPFVPKPLQRWDGRTFPAQPANVPTAALVKCPQLEQHMQNLASRIQKLERSKGQIQKDVQDMKKESEDWKQALKDEAKQKADRRGPSEVKDVKEAKKEQLKEAPAATVAAVPGYTEGLKPPLAPPPGIGSQESPQLRHDAVEGGVVRITWRIDRAMQKFKESVGRPLVSQPIVINADLPEMRLMVKPDFGQSGVNQKGLTTKEQKQQCEDLIQKGKLNGRLELKVANDFEGSLHNYIEFYLFVGTVKKDLARHDFKEKIIYGEDFKEKNWLEDREKEALLVGVEIISSKRFDAPPDAPPGIGPPPGLS